MTQEQCLARAQRLAETIEVNCIELGRLLKKINDRGWHKSAYATFRAYCEEALGLGYRRALYLTAIATAIDSGVLTASEVHAIRSTKAAKIATATTSRSQAERWVKFAKNHTCSALINKIANHPDERRVCMAFYFTPAEADRLNAMLAGYGAKPYGRDNIHSRAEALLEMMSRAPKKPRLKLAA